MEYTYAEPLQAGDTIAVVAPSSALAGDDVIKGLTFLRSLGYEVKIGKSVSAFDGYLAGPDRLRARISTKPLPTTPSRPSSACVAAMGRRASCRSWTMSSLRPIPNCSSASAILRPCIRPSSSAAACPIHGTMVMSLGRNASEYTKEQFAYGLQHPYEARELPLPPGCQPETLVPGAVTGPLAGGNMMLLSVLMGTPYAIDPPDGAILCLEEVGEEAYALDRMLCQFEESGLIDRVRAIAFGEFHHCGPDEGARYEWTVKEVLQAYARKWGKPAVMGLPFGHGADNAWLPLGQMAGLEARLDGVRFTLL